MSADDPPEDPPVAEPVPPKPGLGPPFLAKDWVAIILAIGAAVSILCVCLAVMWDAIGQGAEVSENGTQIITGVLGAIIGVLGSYLGFNAAQRRQDHKPPDQQEPPP